ncbi:MAG TPA: amino acid adenylation domain-containing protein, partial [Chthonomonadaceae bacterium]|nr:amino acid adenylation domain-containing protein [Chthonomonadaceae bacterium]
MRRAALHMLLDHSAQRRPEHPAVEEPEQGAITYRELAALSDRLRDRLHALGVRPGDRVGIYLHKSIDSVASIFGILKTGAAYVPVAPDAPASRNAYILNDCSVKVILVEQGMAEGLRAEMEQLGPLPHLLTLDGTGGGLPLQSALDREQANAPAPPAETVIPPQSSLAYILYTSGSTGKPKGVLLSQENALSFVDWCSEALEPNENDRFSSHAPFHFDLSILDLYVPLKHGATLVLISEELGKDPARLAPLIAERRLTVWYSTPSILSLLAQYGKMERYDYSALRTVLFAGEVFPIKHLRMLTALWPHPRYFNLYGPTETNVCTYQEVPARIPEEQTEPFPIGKVCSHLQARVVDEQGQDVPRGEEGELCIRGPGVTKGYWNLPEQTARAFLADTTSGHWYKTG